MNLLIRLCVVFRTLHLTWIFLRYIFSCYPSPLNSWVMYSWNQFCKLLTEIPFLLTHLRAVYLNSFPCFKSNLRICVPGKLPPILFSKAPRPYSSFVLSTIVLLWCLECLHMLKKNCSDGFPSS